ncbi:MAG: pyruvate, phosphate dikinase/phosphoenolpyruvate synthase regulator [Gammaproteobacteria bacterium]
MKLKRSIFYISDHTANTAEMLGRSLVARFPQIQWQQQAIPYVHNLHSAHRAVLQIDACAKQDQQLPIVIDTLVDKKLSSIIQTSQSYVIDVYSALLPGLAQELNESPSAMVGAQNEPKDTYTRRINAIQFSMEQDDGCNLEYFQDADIVLLGVSRTGKTPTSVYIAVQFGLRAANYPMTPADLEQQRLPPEIEAMHGRLFGLSIEPDTLQSIRQKRWPDSSYASMQQCWQEVQDAREVYEKYKIPCADVTHRSIEEVAAQALNALNINRTTEIETSQP